MIHYTARLPLHQISGRGSICDPLGDYNVWTMPRGIPESLSDKRIILVATKVSRYCHSLYGEVFMEGVVQLYLNYHHRYYMCSVNCKHAYSLVHLVMVEVWVS